MREREGERAGKGNVGPRALLEQGEIRGPYAATPAAWVATAPTPAFAHGTTEPTAR
jgi:hypothetical protein